MRGVRRWLDAFGGLALCALILLGSPQPGSAQHPGNAQERLATAAERVAREVPRSLAEVRLSFAPVVREVAPAVVSVTSRRERPGARSPFEEDPFFRFFFGEGAGPRSAPRRVETSLGSGVIVRDGLVVTNHHVVEGADEIEVVLADRRVFPATIAGSDEGSDLAFLRVKTDGERLPALTLGDSDAIEVGDIVLAIGNPFGIGQTVTSGIVSAKERSAPSLDQDVSFIQTDAAINPGNSGGALVTLDGRLIGINTAIFTRGGGSIGIGFAIPANLVQARLGAVAGGATELRRPWLGASLRTVVPDVAQALGLPRPRGLLVEQVYPKSAADRAGMVPGDVVTAVDGVMVDEPAALNYRMALRPLGASVPFELLRAGAAREVEVELEPPPSVPRPDLTRLVGASPLAGAEVANMSPGFNDELGLDAFERGVVVVDVARGAPATRLRLRRGDVIESVNGTEVESVAALRRALESRRRSWEIAIRRGGQTTRLTVRES